MELVSENDFKISVSDHTVSFRNQLSQSSLWQTTNPGASGWFQTQDLRRLRRQFFEKLEVLCLPQQSQIVDFVSRKKPSKNP